MIEIATERAAERGVRDVRFEVVNADHLTLA
jgi:ubiquinone/menaquinone biosynthesis C-methylase UbiE